MQPTDLLPSATPNTPPRNWPLAVQSSGTMGGGQSSGSTQAPQYAMQDGQSSGLMTAPREDKQYIFQKIRNG